MSFKTAVLGLLGSVWSAGVLLAAPPIPGGDAPRGVTGGDMTFCELFDFFQYGREADIVGLAVGTTSWNIGSADLMWFGSPAAEHPFIAMNLYRLQDDRFEQIGQSWVKHGFFALDDTQCGGTCTFESGHALGNWLGMGCTDTYSSPLNANQSGLGPRYEINPWTGGWSFTGSHFDLGGPPHTNVSHRLQVHDADLDPALNPGAAYFVEAYYVMSDDIDVMNSASWKPVTVSGASGGLWTFTTSDRFTPPTIGFAIDAWAGAAQTLFAQQVPPIEFVSPDGRCILAAKATPLAGAYWRYEYALLNIDMDRQVGSIQIPISGSAMVANLGFHAVEHHDEPVNAPGGVPIDNAPWNDSVGSLLCLSGGINTITWSTTTNPLRWGTLYNFRFDANVPPVNNAQITLGLFKPGSPAQITAAALGPSLAPADCDQNGIPDCEEIALDPGLDCDGNAVLDICDPNCDGVGPPDACVIAACLGDPACADCNGNAVPDGCDLAGFSSDCNGNAIPDECEVPPIGAGLDCNANLIPDACEVPPLGAGPDCNTNGIPDDCEVPPIGAGPDCNTNGVPDVCEADCNLNGTPDDCELPACPAILAGDMDCSGVVDTGDLPEFLDYVLSGSPSCRADLNHDLLVDGLDVQCFIDSAVNASPCP
ncbi:MAG: hypothetical protein ACE5E1_03150 [Phycisphaerae bacterium]